VAAELVALFLAVQAPLALAEAGTGSQRAEHPAPPARCAASSSAGIPIRHAEAMAASFVTELQAAEDAVEGAAQDLLAAQERHAKALDALRCVSGDQQQWRSREHRLAQELDQHLGRQRQGVA
jgi:hypothetical protein